MYLTFFKNKLNNTSAPISNYTFEDLFNNIEFTNQNITFESLARINFETVTVKTNNRPSSFNSRTLDNVKEQLISMTHKYLGMDMSEYYKKFYIPKKSSNEMREINAPVDLLMHDLKIMQSIFQYQLNVLYHNSAYAYVPHRNIKQALEQHTKNNSHWFLKLDIRHFFPSCNLEFVVKQLKKIYPFEYYSIDDLRAMLWICFLNDELPQGTPMSPMLTNLIMIPIDYAINKYAQEHNLVYTRYADDIIISSYKKWDWQQTVEDVSNILVAEETPFELKREKTRFGSSSGRNWNLGLMVNKDNNITVGYRTKKKYKAMLNNILTLEASGQGLTKDIVYQLQGLTSYYKNIEPEYFNKIIRQYEQMYNITLKEIYKRYL